MLFNIKRNMYTSVISSWRYRRRLRLKELRMCCASLIQATHECIFLMTPQVQKFWTVLSTTSPCALAVTILVLTRQLLSRSLYLQLIPGPVPFTCDAQRPLRLVTRLLPSRPWQQRHGFLWAIARAHRGNWSAGFWFVFWGAEPRTIKIPDQVCAVCWLDKSWYVHEWADTHCYLSWRKDSKMTQ